MPDSDRIIEIAMVVTDSQLQLVAEGPVLVVHQPDEVLEAMDSWNKGTHGKSGLIDKVRASTPGRGGGARRRCSSSSRQHVPAGASPMCGNSICQDRRFLARWMPRLEAHFHYRNLDVSTLKELVRRWKPEVGEGPGQGGQARGARRHPRVDRGAEVLPQDGNDDLKSGQAPSSRRFSFGGKSGLTPI